MSKRIINYKRNRKKSRRSSPGRTPGPFGRIHQKHDFNDILKEINRLKLNNELSKVNEKKTNKSTEMIKGSKFPSKLLLDNLKEQSQIKIPLTPSFEHQQVENVGKRDEAMGATKSEKLSSIDPIIKLSVKERVKMFETAQPNKSTISINVRRFAEKMANPSPESFVQEKKHRSGTPMPKYR